MGIIIILINSVFHYSLIIENPLMTKRTKPVIQTVYYTLCIPEDF